MQEIEVLLSIFVLNPVVNIIHWKAVKSQGGTDVGALKEEVQARIRSTKYRYQEVDINSSVSKGSNSVMNFEDRPILGELKVNS